MVVLVTQGGGAPAVRRSVQTYDGLLVGVVSQNPGLVFDHGQTHLAGDNSQLITDDQTVVALMGRVLVNVSLENGAIAIGDPLTSATQPGAAMKATRGGKIIGYALEAAEHSGQALVLVQPGYFVPGDAQTEGLQAQVKTLEAQNAALQQQNAAQQEQNVALDARLTGLEQSLHPSDTRFQTAESALPTTWVLLGGLVVLVNGLLLTMVVVHMRRGGRTRA